jgi:hypothetical protein
VHGDGVLAAGWTGETGAASAALGPLGPANEELADLTAQRP